MEKIREYLNGLFEYAPKTKRAFEMKEEMIANAEEKFADLLREGYSEEDAFAVVVNSIGNVDELFLELEIEEREAVPFTELELKLQQRKAKLTAISVGMYVFAGAVFFFFCMLQNLPGSGSVDFESIGLAIAAIICVVPTALLVYASMSIPQYKKRDDSLVEEYKEKKSGGGSEKSLRHAITSLIWTLTLVLYFTISFTTFAWHITWVIFLVAGCIEAIVSILFTMKN